MTSPLDIIKAKTDATSFERISQLKNDKLHSFIAEFIELCEPDTVYVGDDSEECKQYIRDKAIEKGEERLSAKPGQTFHFGSYYDQARDKANTKCLVAPGQKIGPGIGVKDRDEGVKEVREILKGIMKGKDMIVKCYCLGPQKSKFSIPAVQITDSYYVIHSENILYRQGYETFRAIGNSEDFFRFVHSVGRLENNVCVDIDKRRVYMDLTEDLVYSTNTQYAGNSVGLKKLAMRLAIQKACREDWLTEHMFIMGVKGAKDPSRITYFTGAFPSACGKTSTSMLPGETIVGDDITYIREVDGHCRAANVESGIFGIIADVNSEDDPMIYETLLNSEEVIFNNCLIQEDNTPYWIGKDGEVPTKGINHAGDWTTGMKGPDDKEVTPSHKNARYTLCLSKLPNLDVNANNPDGVEVGGYIYGGRDSDTTVPVEEAFDFEDGIVNKGASIESETTAATIGKEGVRAFNIMSNQDFLSVPFGKYIQDNLDLGSRLQKKPLVFLVNYFLRGKDGEFLNGKQDKHVWLKWMDQRANKEVDALKTPTGLIPKYEDLKELFKSVLDRDYPKEQYIEEFTIRIPELLAKTKRVEKIYREKVEDTPETVFKLLEKQKESLETWQKEFGDYISPEKLEVVSITKT